VSAPVREVHLGPNPGPQTHYVASSADITAFGGAAGGGKTLGTLFRFAWHADTYPGYFGAVFRREMPMITAGGGLWEESMGLYPVWGAVPNISLRQWRFPNGSLIQFRSLQHETDVLNYQGAQFAEFCLEEATHFPESMFWYMVSRLRSNCGMKPRACLTFNPDPDSWVRKLIDHYIGKDGFAIAERACKLRYFVRDRDELIWGDSPEETSASVPHVKSTPKSLRFIPAMLADNPKGDPTYGERLQSLPLVERERLLGGNWNIRAAAGTVFKKSWFEIIDRLPDDAELTCRGWDLAATEPSDTNRNPDWTRGVKLSKHKSGLFVVHDVIGLRQRTHHVDEAILKAAHSDGRGCIQGLWQDPGAAGKSEAERYVRKLAGFDVRIERASKDKVEYSRPVSAQAEGKSGYGNIKLLRAPWNESFLNELEAFPDGAHDDAVDALSRAFLELTRKQVVPTRPLQITGL
jgi:predicted phage terminase large subunit-like protein